MKNGRLEAQETGNLAALWGNAFVKLRFVESLARRLNEKFNNYAVDADPYPTRVLKDLESHGLGAPPHRAVV